MLTLSVEALSPELETPILALTVELPFVFPAPIPALTDDSVDEEDDIEVDKLSVFETAIEVSYDFELAWSVLDPSPEDCTNEPISLSLPVELPLSVSVLVHHCRRVV